jgi:hypothetical protein
MSNEYLLNALLDALAEAAKDRNLRAVREIYDSIEWNREPDDMDLDAEDFESESSRQSYGNMPAPIMSSLDILSVLSAGLMRQFFIDSNGRAPFQFTAHDLYVYLGQKPETRHMAQTRSFRNQLRTALYAAVTKHGNAKNYSISDCLRRSTGRGEYIYDPSWGKREQEGNHSQNGCTKPLSLPGL